jgi:steroid delta-isomerase-like uncharacterized protein
MGGTGTEAVRAAVDALNRGDVATYESAFAANCERWMLGVATPMTSAEVATTLRDLHRAFREFRLEEELLFGCGDRVVARWRATGVHQGEFAGIAPTGRAISVETCEIYELTDGRVTATWSYGDPLDLARQLGALQ